jgi:hypothetical protein
MHILARGTSHGAVGTPFCSASREGRGIWFKALSRTRFVPGDSRRPKQNTSKVRNVRVLGAVAVFRTC